MKINYANEASKLLSTLSRVDIPVEIYELAKKCNIHVLIRAQESDSNDSSGGDASNTKTMFLSEKLIHQLWQSTNPKELFPWEKSEYYLLINSDNSLERRLLTAYHIAEKHLAEKEGKRIDGDIISQSIPTNTIVYNLALYILVPEDNISNFLREFELTTSEALSSNIAIEKLTQFFLVSKIDIVNRLKLSEGANYGCE